MNYIIVYKEVRHLLKFLTESERSNLWDILFDYSEKKEIITLSANLENVFNILKPRLDSQMEKAELKARIARENGATGGRPKADKKPKKTQSKPKITQPVIEEQFESFWNLYDKKTGKADAEKKFAAALKKDTFENIFAGLEKYIKTRGVESKYWKDPSTWLNKECWKDDYTQAKSTDSGFNSTQWSKY